METILVPELGEGIEKATVACWHIGLGDAVQPDDDIAELVTDKATFSISADTQGVLKEIRYQEGEEAKIGDILAIIETTS